MKKTLVQSLILVVIAALIVSCSKDSKDIPDPNPIEGDGNVVLVIRDQGMGGARAYVGTDQAVAGEIELANTLAVYVYNDLGNLEYVNPAMPFTTSGGTGREYISSSFKLSPGNKYFYVFSNGQATPPNYGETYNDLEIQTPVVTFPSSVPTPIAVSGAMSIGTLWRGQNIKTVDAPQPGVTQNISLDIGRAGAKVNLIGVDKGTSTLQGTFGNISYRLRSVPNKYYVVGQLGAAGYPPTQNLPYISAVHNEPPVVGTNQNPIFEDYPWPGKPINNAFYAVENTTARQALQGSTDEFLYFGNTTYFCF